jgi:hypothetical protein
MCQVFAVLYASVVTSGGGGGRLSPGMGVGMADFDRTPLDVSAWQLELALFERRYQVPSPRLVEAFEVDGQLVESQDFRRWSFVYSVLHRRGLAA